LDIGLSKVNTQQVQKLVLRNDSPVAAEFVVKSSKNKRLSFAALKDPESRSEFETMTGKPIVTKMGNNIDIDLCRARLQPN